MRLPVRSLLRARRFYDWLLPDIGRRGVCSEAMRLVQFHRRGKEGVADTRVGVEQQEGGGVVDLNAFDPSLPSTMRGFLETGERGMETARSFLTQWRIRRTYCQFLSDIRSPISVEITPQTAVASGQCVVPWADLTLLAPITAPDKVVCVGMNYRDHCLEQRAPVPTEPIIFSKFPSAIVGPHDNVTHPAESQEVDWEVELAFVIGRTGKHIKEDDALAHVAGFTVANDISARDWQMKRNGKQWLLGKTFDTFCPLGPALVTTAALSDPHNLGIRCRVNSSVVQDSNTNQMIFKTQALVAWVSQFVTLFPGDVFLTGTPPGVGVFRKPPVFLKWSDPRREEPGGGVVVVGSPSAHQLHQTETPSPLVHHAHSRAQHLTAGSGSTGVEVQRGPSQSAGLRCGSGSRVEIVGALTFLNFTQLGIKEGWETSCDPVFLPEMAQSRFSHRPTKKDEIKVKWAAPQSLVLSHFFQECKTSACLPASSVEHVQDPATRQTHWTEPPRRAASLIPCPGAEEQQPEPPTSASRRDGISGLSWAGHLGRSSSRQPSSQLAQGLFISVQKADKWQTENEGETCYISLWVSEFPRGLCRALWHRKPITSDRPQAGHRHHTMAGEVITSPFPRAPVERGHLETGPSPPFDLRPPSLTASDSALSYPKPPVRDHQVSVSEAVGQSLTCGLAVLTPFETDTADLVPAQCSRSLACEHGWCIVGVGGGTRQFHASDVSEKTARGCSGRVRKRPDHTEAASKSSKGKEWEGRQNSEEGKGTPLSLILSHAGSAALGCLARLTGCLSGPAGQVPGSSHPAGCLGCLPALVLVDALMASEKRGRDRRSTEIYENEHRRKLLTGLPAGVSDHRAPETGGSSGPFNGQSVSGQRPATQQGDNNPLGEKHSTGLSPESREASEGKGNSVATLATRSPTLPSGCGIHAAAMSHRHEARIPSTAFSWRPKPGTAQTAVQSAPG
ncbi:FAHD2 protein, partial [Atractosteus spatula]|nr:FAHD2 protein [Atractosteus spatula]